MPAPAGWSKLRRRAAEVLSKDLGRAGDVDCLHAHRVDVDLDIPRHQRAMYALTSEIACSVTGPVSVAGRIVT